MANVNLIDSSTIRVVQNSNNISLASNANEYSTTETVIGTWIDGRPIYRQVIDKAGIVNADTWFTIKAMPNVDNITYHYIFFDWGITGSYLCRVENNNFEIYVRDTLHILKVIVEYTKTTD